MNIVFVFGGIVAGINLAIGNTALAVTIFFFMLLGGIKEIIEEFSSKQELADIRGILDELLLKQNVTSGYSGYQVSDDATRVVNDIKNRLKDWQPPQK